MKNISLRNWLESSFQAYPQELTNIFVDFDLKKRNKKFIDQIVQNYSANYSENCRIFIRPSGTEPLLRVLVEAPNREEVQTISKRITSEIRLEINNIDNSC